MADDSSEAYELLNRITDEYMDRIHRGDRPTADEYYARYPHLAEEIRDLLGAMVEIEQVEEDLRESQCGPHPLLRLRATMWATTTFSARSVGVEWGLFTKPSKFHSVDGSL